MKYLVLLLLLLSLPLFFFKLGDSSLVSWDEAWYASIAKDILKTGDIFRLSWNGRQYVDHPPVGFLTMALSFKIFGVNEFWARFPSAVTGVLSLIVVYLLAKELFNRWVGLFSMVALVSSPWFIFRARSGNLDSFLVLFFSLSFYLALKYLADKKYGVFLGISLAILLLTKTLVGFTIVPVLLFLFWKEKKLAYLVSPFLIGFVSFTIWFLIQYFSFEGFVARFFDVGARGVGLRTNFLANLSLFKGYLHQGIGRWFWPGVLSLAVLPFLKQKKAYILSLFFIIFSLPFLFSNKGQIWHLLPLHPILIVSALGLAYVLLDRFTKNKIVNFLVILLATIFLSYPQIRQNWYNFIDIPAFVSDEAILSREAGKYPYKFYIDDDFDPVAAFYSDKIIEQIQDADLTSVFAKNESFVLITYEWRLKQAKIKPSEYLIVKKDRDKILVVRE